MTDMIPTKPQPPSRERMAKLRERKKAVGLTEFPVTIPNTAEAKRRIKEAASDLCAEHRKLKEDASS